MPATVYLIGAGPGAPDLITLRGYRCLQKADVVIFDHLVSPDLLSIAPKHAERIDEPRLVRHELDYQLRRGPRR